MIAVLFGLTSILWPSMRISPAANKTVDDASHKQFVNDDHIGVVPLTHWQVIRDPLFWRYFCTFLNNATGLWYSIYYVPLNECSIFG
jgi:hypothetical protein